MANIPTEAQIAKTEEIRNRIISERQVAALEAKREEIQAAREQGEITPTQAGSLMTQLGAQILPNPTIGGRRRTVRRAVRRNRNRKTVRRNRNRNRNGRNRRN